LFLFDKHPRRALPHGDTHPPQVRTGPNLAFFNQAFNVPGFSADKTGHFPVRIVADRRQMNGALSAGRKSTA
jgi:hypothetical protein